MEQRTAISEKVWTVAQINYPHTDQYKVLVEPNRYLKHNQSQKAWWFTNLKDLETDHFRCAGLPIERRREKWSQSPDEATVHLAKAHGFDGNFAIC